MKGRKRVEEPRSHKIQVTVTATESLSVFAKAKDQGVSMSEFVRNLILEKIGG